MAFSKESLDVIDEIHRLAHEDNCDDVKEPLQKLFDKLLGYKEDDYITVDKACRDILCCSRARFYEIARKYDLKVTPFNTGFIGYYKPDVIRAAEELRRDSLSIMK